jgi:hypothetical protein
MSTFELEFVVCIKYAAFRMLPPCLTQVQTELCCTCRLQLFSPQKKHSVVVDIRRKENSLDLVWVVISPPKQYLLLLLDVP